MTSLLDVSNARTWDDLHETAAHPRLEGQLHILSSVRLEPLVIPPQVFKERPVNCEQTTGHHRSIKRGDRIFRLDLLLRDFHWKLTVQSNEPK